MGSNQGSTGDSKIRELSQLVIPAAPVIPASSPEPRHLDIRTSRPPSLNIRSEDVIPDRVKILPRIYSQCAIEDMVLVASGVIEEAIRENDGKSPSPLSKGLTPFHSR